MARDLQMKIPFWSINDKPDSVVYVHSSGVIVANHLKQPTHPADEK